MDAITIVDDSAFSDKCIDCNEWVPCALTMLISPKWGTETRDFMVRSWVWEAENMSSYINPFPK